MKKSLIVVLALAASMAANAAFVEGMTPEQIKAEVALEKSQGIQLDAMIKAALQAGVSAESVFDAYAALEIESNPATGAGQYGRPSFASAGGSSFSGGGGGAASRN